MSSDLDTLPLWVVLSTPEVDRERYLPTLPEHLAYQRSLEERGVLVAAGPLADTSGNRSGRGLIVYRAATAEEAAAIAEADPLHAKGLRTYTLEAWAPAEGTAMRAGIFSHE